ncbi:hypothetical protein OUZ56_032016 [Daphnia magna]|uniref:Uncharacterized protein n=1 Tax=Daphnia magna TaxID=35525 RepID=A0ABQ9ZVW6_9CRUS|nr:hypothetical protein OUZ56_032016 [Daphnia magna]
MEILKRKLGALKICFNSDAVATLQDKRHSGSLLDFPLFARFLPSLDGEKILLSFQWETFVLIGQQISSHASPQTHRPPTSDTPISFGFSSPSFLYFRAKDDHRSLSISACRAPIVSPLFSPLKSPIQQDEERPETHTAIPRFSTPKNSNRNRKSFRTDKKDCGQQTHNDIYRMYSYFDAVFSSFLFATHPPTPSSPHKNVLTMTDPIYYTVVVLRNIAFAFNLT